jgi:hypothetical protein
MQMNSHAKINQPKSLSTGAGARARVPEDPKKAFRADAKAHS